MHHHFRMRINPAQATRTPVLAFRVTSSSGM
jgi:hypothetical protein